MTSPGPQSSAPPGPTDPDHDPLDESPPCVLVFNASDPSGAGGLSADLGAIASVGVHALPIVTGAYTRDTAEILDHHAFDDEAVSEQARTVLEDITVQVIKVGFAGSIENLSVIAEIAADYADVPVIAYMPDLSWWNEVQIDLYLDAFRDLVLPQTTVLVGNHSTLCRWLLPDWQASKPPGPRDIARAAQAAGAAYTLVTGIPLPDHRIDNVLASPQSVIFSGGVDRLGAGFSGAGDTLSGALAALLATQSELGEAVQEALGYLDRCLEAGFRPGMGHRVPDRLFWAQPEPDEESADNADDSTDPRIDFPDHDTKH
ncbi:MAG: bifunctional hydroxymethylpyrimidine kinase/phosphomethylpyrimidine kinase [Rhodoferax sp.]|jgi:hydroxymethylpyrimidine/phosphomethylpyrimidine kinase|nr:bifunctional hydroxymethylpyrimidine kinase/phosphomethylpyrimidine kinase [Rhodoferax sp.]